MQADVCSTLLESGLFTGLPYSNYTRIKLDNNAWHFTSPVQRLIYRLRNGNHFTYCPVSLDLNFSRFYAHAPCDEADLFLLPEVVNQGNAQTLMRRREDIKSELAVLTLDDSDNILLHHRYAGTTATIACLRYYLDKVFAVFEEAFGQRQPEHELREAITEASYAPPHLFEGNQPIAFIDRREFIIQDAEFYIDFKHPDAVEQAKQMGRVLKRIGRKIIEDEYTGIIQSNRGVADVGNCYSYRAALNNNRELKIYAKTSTRIRIEICFKGNLRNHIKRVNNAVPLDNIVQLFSACDLLPKVESRGSRVLRVA